MDRIINLNNSNFDSTINNLNKDILIEFWASWCPPCKMMDKLLNELASEEKFVIAKVNIDQNKVLADRFNIMGAPSFIKYQKNKFSSPIVGAKSKKQLLNFMASDSLYV